MMPKFLTTSCRRTFLPQAILGKPQSVLEMVSPSYISEWSVHQRRIYPQDSLYIMADDWDTVTVLRKRAPNKATMKSESALNQARRAGTSIDTQQKYGASSNKQHVTTKNTAKLDRETEELRHASVSTDTGKVIMQARQAKAMSQKDLATRICEKQQVVTDYEAGRGIPNNVILGKMERALGVKLRGKDRGQPLVLPERK